MSVLDEINAAAPAPAPKVPPVSIEIWETRYTQDGVLEKWSISALKLNNLIGSLGFCRLDLPSGPVFVRITNDAVVELVQKHNIQDAVFDHVNALPNPVDGRKLFKNELLDKLLRSIGTWSNEDKLHQVRPDAPVVFAKDDKQNRFFFFTNGYIGVGPKTATFQTYDTLSGCVWRSEILPRHYYPNAKHGDAVFAQFLKLVSGSEERFNDLCRITGYLLHQDIHRKQKALILTDSAIGDGGEANGRTGKSLYAKALGYAMAADPEQGGTVVNVNGKDFDPSYRHKWQEVTPQTRVVVLDDVKAGFQPETLYNDITEGLSVQKKNDTPFKIKANLIITTNKTIRLDGESDKDRFIEFEFTGFFSSKKSPADHFGHWFFSQWNHVEWAKFDALMIHCVRQYLKDGLPVPKTINLEARKLLERTSPEFIEWQKNRSIPLSRSVAELEAIAKSKGEDWTIERVAQTERHKDQPEDKKILFDNFTAAYPDFGERGRYKLTRRKFHHWLVDFTKYAPGLADFKAERDEYHSNAETYFIWRKEK